MHPALLTGALVVAVAWLPILLKFYRAWTERKHPVSIAISLLITFVIYLPLYSVLSGQGMWALTTTVVIDGLLCGVFYLAFWLAKYRFSGPRA